MAEQWATGVLTRADYVLMPSPYKTVVARSRHGREPRNWRVFSEFWQIELTYRTWGAAMASAESLATTGKVSTFHLVGVHNNNEF